MQKMSLFSFLFTDPISQDACHYFLLLTYSTFIFSSKSEDLEPLSFVLMSVQ